MKYQQRLSILKESAIKTKKTIHMNDLLMTVSINFSKILMLNQKPRGVKSRS